MFFERVIVFKSTNNKPITIRQLIYAGLIAGYLNLNGMNLYSQCSLDHIIRRLNILEIYISITSPSMQNGGTVSCLGKL